MQSKLSKLQKAILIFIYHNQHPFVLREFQEEKMVFHEELIHPLAEKFDKLVKGKRGKNVKPSFHRSIGRSVDALAERKLVLQIQHPRGYARCIALTPEGIETAKELLG